MRWHSLTRQRWTPDRTQIASALESHSRHISGAWPKHKFIMIYHEFCDVFCTSLPHGPSLSGSAKTKYASKGETVGEKRGCMWPPNKSTLSMALTSEMAQNRRKADR